MQNIPPLLLSYSSAAETTVAMHVVAMLNHRSDRAGETRVIDLLGDAMHIELPKWHT
jgi:hypothetical protein